MGNVVDWPALRDSAASDRSLISVRETETHGGTLTVPEKLEISYRHLWAAQGVKRGLGTNKGTRGLRSEGTT